MCGILGYFNPQDNNIEQFIKMLSLLHHRGPDDEGIWSDEKIGLRLGHKRLSIIDLSQKGKQPMISKSGRYIIVFNGEIYNYLKIKQQIIKSPLNNEKINWDGFSDTEVILNSVDIFGINQTIKKLHGMFAIALYDRKKQEITLARDRFGEKPLYYGFFNNQFFFSSELKPLKFCNNFDKIIDRKSVNLYLQYGYIPSPYSIYINVKKLEPATILKLNLFNFNQIEKVKYWKLQDLIKSEFENNLINKNNILDKYEENLFKSINSQTMSDVGFGVFLSSGLDSSLIAAILSKNQNNKIDTFSIGLNNNKYDESKASKKIANCLNTNHNEIIISHKDLLDKVNYIPKAYDEPFSDSSQIPTMILSENARKIKKVFLTGDGGDEILGGYNRHNQIERFYNLNYLTKQILKIIIKVLNTVDFDYFYNYINFIISKNIRSSLPSDHIYKVNLVINSKSKMEAYQKIISIWQELEEVSINLDNYQDVDKNINTNLDFKQQIMLQDSINYLPNDILCKVDRASMFYSLETRAPYLDYGFVKFIYSLPSQLHPSNLKDKSYSKKILYKYLPKNLVDRPKIGFGIPLADWLNGPLKDWAEELLNKDKIDKLGFFNSKKINQILNSDLKNNYTSHKIWNILMFQLWAEEYLK